MESVKEKMKQLKLSGALKSLGERNDFALRERISYVEFLDLLLEDECAVRNSNAYKRRLAHSKVSEQKRLDNYDFNFQPDIDRKLINDLSTCRFINENHNLIFMGKPGVGKTHLANALGLKAVEKGYRVLMTHANEITDAIHRSRADGSDGKLIRKLSKYDLLIIDEMGFKSFPKGSANDFFDVIRSRYENGSIIITTNRDFQGWEGLFGDAVIASAIIDRLVHHAHIIKIIGESYRIKSYDKKKEN